MGGWRSSGTGTLEMTVGDPTAETTAVFATRSGPRAAAALSVSVVRSGAE